MYIKNYEHVYNVRSMKTNAVCVTLETCILHWPHCWCRRRRRAASEPWPHHRVRRRTWAGSFPAGGGTGRSWENSLPEEVRTLNIFSASITENIENLSTVIIWKIDLEAQGSVSVCVAFYDLFGLVQYCYYC